MRTFPEQARDSGCPVPAARLQSPVRHEVRSPVVDESASGRAAEERIRVTIACGPCQDKREIPAAGLQSHGATRERNPAVRVVRARVAVAACMSASKSRPERARNIVWVCGSWDSCSRRRWEDWQCLARAAQVGERLICSGESRGRVPSVPPQCAVVGGLSDSGIQTSPGNEPGRHSSEMAVSALEGSKGLFGP